MLTVLIPFFNGDEYIRGLLDSIPSTVPVVVVNDMSRNQPEVGDYANVTLFNSQSKGYFTGAVNQGLRLIDPTSDVLILNQDSLINWPYVMDVLNREKGEYALIGERIKGTNNAWPNGYIHGTFMYIRHDLRAVLPQMDAETFPLWGSTADYQLKACRMGFKALPLAFVLGYKHLRHGATGSSIKELFPNPKDHQRFFRVPPLVSVVVNMYNQGRYIPDLMASLFGGDSSLGKLPPQTMQAFEVIIVDDGSTDDSLKLARKYQTGWNGVTVLHKRNGGSASAMNHGIKYAQGEYIAAIDSDDMMAPDRLEKMYKMAVAHGGKRVICDDVLVVRQPNQFRLDENGKAVTTFFDGEEHPIYPHRPMFSKRGLFMTMVMKEHSFHDLLNSNKMHKGIMFSKAAWLDAGGYRENFNRGREDWSFNVALAEKGYCGLLLREPLYYYRQHSNNRTLTNTDEFSRVGFAKKMRETFPKLYRGEFPMSCCGANQYQVVKRGDTVKNKQQTQLLQEGMVKIEYLGTSSPSTFTAPKSNRKYVFGAGKHAVKYVFAADVDHFLNLWQENKKIFRELKEAPVVVAEPEPIAVATTVNSWEEYTADDAPIEIGFVPLNHAEEPLFVTPPAEIEDDGFLIDPNDFTIKRLKDELPALRYTVEQLEAVKEMELAGNGRLGVISYLNDEIARLRQ